jgi:voltage-gated potassium channel
MNDDVSAAGGAPPRESHPGTVTAAATTNTSPRLERYVQQSRAPLDLFAMFTLWLVLVPLADFDHGRISVYALVARVSISVVYAIDIAYRAHLAPHGPRYVREHPLALLAVVVPPIRVLFSLRLIKSLFQRGHLDRFLVASAVMLLNGAIVVYFVERDDTGANIVTAGDAIWWSIVTVTTVGYGDLYPVTAYGRTVAVGIMFIGILTLAVITAHVSSNFNEQARQRRDDRRARARARFAAESAPVTPVPSVPSAPSTPPSDATVSLAELRELRDRIDAVLASAGSVDERSPRSDDDESG